jgi:arginine exporter protein ArgO
MSGYVESFSFIGGVFCGSVMWWLILCFTVGLFRTRISSNLLRYINYISGAVIVSFGVYALMQAACTFF